MAGQLIPPPELAPPIPENLTPTERIALWAQVYDAGEQLLLAGLTRQAGANGDPLTAYRAWYKDYLEQHDRRLVQLVHNLHRSEENRAGKRDN